jgi:hypothetical protein
MNNYNAKAGECPHCGQRMLIRHGVKLPPLLADIFDLIEHSGKRGITREVLASVFWSDKSRKQAEACASVNINRINDFMVETDVSIRMSGRPQGLYKVTRGRPRRAYKLQANYKSNDHALSVLRPLRGSQASARGSARHRGNAHGRY